ncbi:DUF1415 domain-containing protein [Rhodoferax mekongensis]|uniref:DUF1415 domain-containing protein n=1 Tax=Rhodoferax mekongensis TaxID=3068341 RepID=A0ABZ0B3H6_9BURK|nr:DUF1415 domain-containing protein [Rhodoferax sp. TBRC 17307]WNO06185.1 DUF1415 domain-containing protein [Rhodoferax sp. TBRC 17307]
MSELSNQQPSADDAVVKSMQRWLERAVIGLNLCPFAKAVHVKNQVHYVVCRATEPADVLDVLREELLGLAQADPQVRDTTLLILPDAFREFVNFNDFLYSADKALRKLKLDGELQIASFHPQFQFADAEPDDIGNFTNRAPYPTLHLLREASIDKAVEAFPAAEQIYEKNIATLQRLGPEGWAALQVGPHIAPL